MTIRITDLPCNPRQTPKISCGVMAMATVSIAAEPSTIHPSSPQIHQATQNVHSFGVPSQL